MKADCTHVYYGYPLVYRRSNGVDRALVFDALRAEGVPVGDRYVNLHLLPLYQKKIAYGTKGFPWTAGFYDGHVSYDKGICPVAEVLQDERHLGIGLCINDYGDEDIDLIVEAFRKVWRHMDLLRGA